jgi:hypothetical protein
MMKLLNKLVLLLVLALGLSACSDVFFQQPYRVILEPSQLGYQVEGERLTIVPNTAYVEAIPGAPAGRLERYTYVVVDDSGYEVFPGASLGSGDVGVGIPEGREEVEGGYRFVTRRSQPFTFSLDGAVAQAHWNQGAPLNWRLRVTWYATTANGQPVEWVQEYQIKSPLR